MINETNNWLKMALQLRGSVAPKIFPRVVFCAMFGFLVSLCFDFGVPIYEQVWIKIDANIIFNFVLGLLLVFRTNTAYDKFWEGRRCWGTLIINTRNLARQIWIGVTETSPEDKQKKLAIIKLLIAFAITTKLHLRSQEINTELENLVNLEQYTKLKQVKNPPLQVSTWIGNYLQGQEKCHCLSNSQMVAMNTLLDNMIDALTGCERILKTPIPLAYSIYLKRLLLIYCIALPFQFVEEVNWWTGIIVGLITFVLFGIEEIGNEIEDPFGLDPNDLPLDDLCQTMSENMQDLITTEDIHTPMLLNLQPVEVE